MEIFEGAAAAEARQYSVYFVSTPIGNAAEMSFRAVEILKSADIIFCEDTRHSLPLLARFNINKPLKACHKFNERAAAGQILSCVQKNMRVAVISDAGMPLISDPGNILVAELKSAGVSYTVVSGPCALVSAFALSGFSAPFAFVGFLPEKAAARQEILDNFSPQCTLVFYVAAHDLTKTLEYLHGALQQREFCLAREISKLHEEVVFGTLGEYSPQSEARGEYVLVVRGVQKSTGETYAEWSEQQHVDFYTSQGLPFMDAVKAAARDRNLPKSEFYSRLIKTKKE